MTKLQTVKIKDGDDYKVVNASDFDETKDEFFMKDTEIIVKPRGVEAAKPFVIEEKDFDAAAYVRVNATEKNLEIIADQTPRETLSEKTEREQSPAAEAMSEAVSPFKHETETTEAAKDAQTAIKTDSPTTAKTASGSAKPEPAKTATTAKTPQNTLKDAQKTKK